MSEHDPVHDVPFVMEVPDDEMRKRYSVPVRFLDQPPMWFKDPDDADTVRQRLARGESPEDIQRSMVSGSSPLKQEYGGEIKPWQASVTPLDNLRLLSVPGTIADMQPQTKAGPGYSVYTNDQGETFRRATLPEWSKLDQENMEKIVGVGASMVGASAGSALYKPLGYIAQKIGGFTGGWAMRTPAQKAVRWAFEQPKWTPDYEDKPYEETPYGYKMD